MGNEESGQTGDYGQIGAPNINTSAVSSSYSARNTQIMNTNTGHSSSSFPGGIRNTNSSFSSMNVRSQAPKPSHLGSGSGPGPPTNVDITDVDLSGLTEEEKRMIQSVMARANEEVVGSQYDSKPKSSINNPKRYLANESSNTSSYQSDIPLHPYPSKPATHTTHNTSTIRSSNRDINKDQEISPPISTYKPALSAPISRSLPLPTASQQITTYTSSSPPTSSALTSKQKSAQSQQQPQQQLQQAYMNQVIQNQQQSYANQMQNQQQLQQSYANQLQNQQQSYNNQNQQQSYTNQIQQHSYTNQIQQQTYANQIQQSYTNQIPQQTYTNQMQNIQQSYVNSTQPPNKTPQIQECWSPSSDLSPDVDLSPSLDTAEQELSSPTYKQGLALIPRTVPLHTVTQQIAYSSSSSIPTSSALPVKHKSAQNQQQSYSNQLQVKKSSQIQECWSPPTDLSPIMDVSPSLEAAEQEISSPTQTLPTHHQALAPIHRAEPTHMVTHQLVSSSASLQASSSMSPKHKSSQNQQQSYPYQLQPKKPPQIQECWSPPTDLSPIMDVSPSIEAAEQEIMENIKTCDSLSSLGSIPRATSGTITGMIADFNKAMEALGSNSPPEEQFSSNTKHHYQQHQQHQQHQQQQQQYQQQQRQKGMQIITPNQQTPATRMINETQNKNRDIHHTTKEIKNQNTSDTSASSEASVHSHSAQPILVFTSGATQTALPLQLQLNPQPVPAASLLPSPQVEQQLQQQQILIQQQQQFLQIQIEQQKLQKQVTEQLSIRQQQEIEKQSKQQKQKEVVSHQQSPQHQQQQQQQPKQEKSQHDKQVSTSTPPSVTSTPTLASSKSVTSSTAIQTKNAEPVVSNATRKASHRRLPQPTTEEIQSAVQTLAAQNISQTSANIPPVPLAVSQRSVSPMMPRKTQTSVISSQVILGPNISNQRRVGMGIAASTVLTTATSTLMSTIAPSTDRFTSNYDRISPSPFSYPPTIRSHTPGYDFPDTQSEIGSGDKGKRRRLPSVPLDEEPISPISATRKLIKDRLAGRATVSTTSISSKRIPALRPSSSLDSATGLPPQRPAQSPFSITSDITQFLASTYGQSVLKSPIGNIKSPSRSPVPPGESRIGSQLQTSLSASSLNSPTKFPSYMKNIKQKLLDELKTASSERQRLMELRERDKEFYRKSETDLQTLYDIYSSPVRRRRGRYRKIASDPKISKYSPTRDSKPFKSYEFESLHPSRPSYGVNYKQQRPMSSMAAYSDVDLDRDNAIPSYMDPNDNEMYMTDNALSQSYRRRSEGSTDMLSKFGYGLDPYGRSFNNYYYDDLTQQRRRLNLNRKPRSWHPSPAASEDEDDQMTREEKAAKIRAEIMRRKKQIVDFGRFYRHSLDESTLPYGSDMYGQSALLDNYYNNYASAASNSQRDYYYGRLKPNYSQPSLHGYDNYNYHQPYVNHTYDSRLVQSNARDAALLCRPNFAHPDVGSIMSTDTDTPSEQMDQMLNTPAMPILPDMPTRSRKLLEDLGSSSIVASGHRSGYRANDHNSMIKGSSPKKTQFAPNTAKYPKYPFPVKRILLTQDPKIRSVNGNKLGLTVVGGKEIPGTTMIGAYIAKIHPNLATMGEIQEGMQVIEWNGIPLTGISHEEVSRIIASQIGDEIEVVIRTDINMIHNPYQNYDQQCSYPQVILQHNHPIDDTSDQLAYQLSHQYNQQTNNDQIVNIVDSHQTPIDQQSFDDIQFNEDTKFDISDEQLGKIRGEIQILICYDTKAAILYVTIIEARNLMCLNDGQLPDPFIKCYLLPPRIIDNQRRTRYYSRTVNPKWNQTMVYPNFHLNNFKRKYLEISVWSFSIYSPHIFLGQINIDLSEKYILDEEPQWYELSSFKTELKFEKTKENNINDSINVNLAQLQTGTHFKKPIIATSTKNKFSAIGDRINRHIISRASFSADSFRNMNI